MPNPPSGLCQCGCGAATKIAPKTHARSGEIKGQPRRFLKGHQGKRPLAERFHEKVEQRGPDECWLWTGGRAGGANRDYGVIGLSGKHGRTNRYAHRVAYELAYGPIPEGMTIDHVRERGCTSKLCCNPAHLEAVPSVVNMRRGMKLSMEIAREVRAAVVAGATQAAVSRAMDVEASQVSRIVSGEIWRELE